MSAPRKPKAAVADPCVCANLRMASRAVTQFYDETMRPAGLRVTQFSILATARRLGPVTLTRLGEATLTDRTTLTRNLAPLARKGWVRIVPGSDRREREVHVTDEGRAALRAAYPYWQAAQARVAEHLGGARLERLLADLQQAIGAAR
ncbi:MAG TPA: MarR family winged helix-turn-helix transcriptional regulator [bacterium]|nr:MarR family winged helix-turn-helix transcriptional regulator [bacterium]